MAIALNFDVERFPTEVAGIRHWIEWTNDGRPSQIILHLEYRGPLTPGAPVEAWDTLNIVINPGILQQWGIEDHEAYFLQAVQWIENTNPTTEEILAHIDEMQLEGFWFPRINMEVQVP